MSETNALAAHPTVVASADYLRPARKMSSCPKEFDRAGILLIYLCWHERVNRTHSVMQWRDGSGDRSEGIQQFFGFAEQSRHTIVDRVWAYCPPAGLHLEKNTAIIPLDRCWNGWANHSCGQSNGSCQRRLFLSSSWKIHYCPKGLDTSDDNNNNGNQYLWHHKLIKYE